MAYESGIEFPAFRRRASAPRNPGGPARFQRILVAIDGSKESEAAIEWALVLARLFQARTWITTVISPQSAYAYYGEWSGPMPAPADLIAEDRAWAAEILEKAAARFRRGRLRVETLIREGSPTAEITKLARRRDAHLVILGSHGHGVAGRFMLGSVADGIKNHVRASVLIARKPPPADDILIATDGSVQGGRAAAIGLALARGFKANARIIFVLPKRRVGVAEWPDAKRLARLRELSAVKGDPRVTYQVAKGRPADRIVGVAQEASCQLIVMGHRGLGGFKSLVAGSVSNGVAHRARCSVLLIKTAPRAG